MDKVFPFRARPTNHYQSDVGDNHYHKVSCKPFLLAGQSADC